MSDGVTILLSMVAFLVAALVLLGIGIVLARKGTTERRRRAGWWIGIVAALFAVAFTIPMALGIAINGLPR